MKESELAYLFGKLKYKENLIDIIYGTNKEKTLVYATPLSTAFFSTSIVQDFQDSPDDEEDPRSSQEYMNDLEEEYQARALLAKSKRFFKKGTQSEQIPTQKKKILGINQLIEDTSRSRPKDLIFVKSSADNSNASITSTNKPRLFEAEDSTLPNHDVGKNREPLSEDILGATTQRDTRSYYPKRYWELLPTVTLRAITQSDTGSYYPK
nr:retrovirus-related Pol polyprotein from transposon TNT 1-94 [Tanacetum cinerariifolium]